MSAARLGTAWAQKAGHEIFFGVRDAKSEKTQARLSKVGGTARAGTPAEAAAFGDFIVLTTPWPQAEAAIHSLGNVNGQHHSRRHESLGDGAPTGIGLEIGHSISAGERVQGWAKGASVFKTLNTTGFANMAEPVFHGVKSVMFVAGDDAANKPKVIALVASRLRRGRWRAIAQCAPSGSAWHAVGRTCTRPRARPRLGVCPRQALRRNAVNTSTSTTHYPAAPTSERVETRTLCVLVDNEPGVLARVIGLFAGRGYNIDSLTVSETEHEKHLSRITIVTRGTPMVLEQIKNQLDRLVPVHRVVDLTTGSPAIQRELAMVKVRGKGKHRAEAQKLAATFDARIIDETAESYVFEITGATDQIESFISQMLPLGLIEVSRTGVVCYRARRRRGCNRHCERSEAIQRKNAGLLRRFAPRNDEVRCYATTRSAAGDKCSTRVAKRSTKACRKFFVLSSAMLPWSSTRFGLNVNVGFAAEQKRAEADEHVAQVLLRQRAADRAGRSAGDEGWLIDPGILAVGPRAPIDGVLQHRRHRPVMLGRDDQHAVGLRDFVLEARHFGREVGFVVLVVHGQVVDAHDFGIEFAGAELGECLGELAVDRFAAVRADDHGDLGLGDWGVGMLQSSG